MVDRWLGRLLERIDDYHLWDDLMLIVTSDHGHYLGEHGWVGKPDSPIYDVLAHTPLFIWHPAGERMGQSVNALTAAVDLYASMLETLDVPVPETSHSRSLLPLLEGKTEQHRDWHLYGYWGRMVNVTDGVHTYLRAPAQPAQGSLYTYSTMMMNDTQSFQPPVARQDAEAGRFLPYADVPCWRYPCLRPPSKARDAEGTVFKDLLFDVSKDPEQRENLVGNAPDVEASMTNLLRSSLNALRAPQEQFERLGL